MTRLPVTGSVQVGGYVLEVGTQTGSFVQFEREGEKEHARALGEALAEKPEERPAAVDAVVELEDTADAVTDQIEHAAKLFRAAAEGRLLERDLLTGEIGALLGLLERLDKAKRFDEELRLARALHGLLVLAFRWLELVRSLRMVLSAARRAGDEAGQAWALHELGSLHLSAGNAERAVENLEEALALEQKLGDAVGRCATRHNLDSARRELVDRIPNGRSRRFRRIALVVGALACFAAGAGLALVIDHTGGDDGATQTVTLAVERVGDGSGTVAGAGGAINCGSACRADLEAGDTVTLTAVADGGSVFDRWKDVDCEGDEVEASCTVTLNDDRVVRAVFNPKAPEDRTLSLVFSGGGSGLVSGTDISCRTDCDEPFEAGSTITLTAEADDGSVFDRWDGADCEVEASCTVTLDDDTALVVVFEEEVTKLTVVLPGEGSGSVSGVEGIDCPDDCDEPFEAGSTVTLKAEADEGFVFDQWDGVECEKEGQDEEFCTVTVNGKTTAVAFFEPAVTLSVKKGGGGTVTSDPGGIDCGETCNADFAKGRKVTLTPVPDDGWEFAGWDKECPGTTGDCTIELTENTVAVAKFREGPG
ncbi:MAG: hypothetical protein HW413_1663 [Thermoleophilia bacterium]|nr:hypothetical protein [Thermoleophilia bacterium]